MRRSGVEGGSMVVPHLAEEGAAREDCPCADGEQLDADHVAAEVREADGLLRVRKAAQRICESFIGTGSLGGAAHATAIFSSCTKGGAEPGYCCKEADSEESADRKKKAPEDLEKKDVALYSRVNSGYRSLMRALEDANIDGTAPETLGEAAVLLAKQRELVEEREARCRADMDNFKECGEPLLFLMDLRFLYTDLAEGVGTLAAAASACTSPRKRVLGAVSRGGRLVTNTGTSLLTRVALYGRRVIAFTWRNRIALMAGAIIAKNAEPFVNELVDSGMDKALAIPMGDAFANVVVAMKDISCQIVREPLLMAALVSLSARFLGNVMVAVTPEDHKDLGSTIEGFKDAKDTGILREMSEVPKAFISQVREFGEVLASNTAVPVASDLLVVFAGDFFKDLAEAICEAVSEGAAPAAMAQAEIVKTPRGRRVPEQRMKPAKKIASSQPKAAKTRSPKVVASKAAKTVNAAKAEPKAASAVPKGANTLAAGALSGLFTGTGFATIGREGAREVSVWARGGADGSEPKARRGKRDKDPSKGRSLAEIAEGSALVESGAEWQEALGAGAAAVGQMLLDSVGKVREYPELQLLETALKDAKVSMPMFALLAWSAEHVLALMSGSDSDFERSGCDPRKKACVVPTLKELKVKSKSVLSDIERLSTAAVSQCKSNSTKAKQE